MDIISIPRWLPFLLAGSGVWVSAKAGAPGIRDLVDMAKVAITKYEMANLAHHVHLDSASNFSLPDPSNQESVSSYIRKSAFTYAGRDPALDLWGQPYLMSRSGAKNWEIRSWGPNGQAGLCAQDVAPLPDASSSDPVTLTDDGQPADTKATSSVGDDVCIVFDPSEY